MSTPTRDPRLVRLALAGNPNVGKSSLFNALTGSDQHVGNWPGKTVERRAGHCRHAGHDVEVVDLPGTYSLSPWSPEEEISRDVLVDDGIDVVVVVVDATNMERSLYVAVEVAELGRPVVIALNMVDRAEKEGIHVDDDALARAFDAPVVRTVGSSGRGREALLEAALQMAAA